MKKYSIYYDVALILLALVSISLLVFEITHDLDEEQLRLIYIIDICIASIFLLDFFLGLYRSKNRTNYFKKHWYELLASIPLTYTTIRALRSIRILRILRIIRIIRIRRISSRLRRFGDATLDGVRFRLFSLAITVLTLVFSATVAFHNFEYKINPNVHNLFDSLWWAVGTVTTINYGDIYPVTTEGRIVAMILAMVGVGALGVVITTIAGLTSKRKENIVQINEEDIE